MWARAEPHPDVIPQRFGDVRHVAAEANLRHEAVAGRTCLQTAAHQGHRTVVELLLLRRANPNVTDCSGATWMQEDASIDKKNQKDMNTFMSGLEEGQISTARLQLAFSKKMCSRNFECLSRRL